MIVINAIRAGGSGGGEVVLESIISKRSSEDVVLVVKRGQRFKTRIENLRYLDISPRLVRIGFAEVGFDLFLKINQIVPRVVICLGDIPVITKYHQVYYYDWYFLELAYKNGLWSIPGLKRKIKVCVFLLLKNWINSFVCQNDLGKSFVEEKLFRHAIVSLPFFPNGKPKKSKVSSLIYPASDAAYKRHDLLKEFASKYPSTTIYVTLGEQAYNSLYLGFKNVINLGWKNRPELIKIMKGIDAVILVSDYESLCLPALEAVDLGKPVFYRGQEFVDCLISNPYTLGDFEIGLEYSSAKLKEGLCSENLLSINYEDLC